MATDLLTSALTAFDIVRTGDATSAEARSGAGVHRVRISAGELGYLKVTPAALGEKAVADAERELRFYRQVASTVPVATPTLLGALSTPEGIALLLSDAGTERPPSAWTGQDWSRLGRDLARVHATPVPSGAWARPDPLATAVSTLDLDQVRAFWTPTLPDLESWLANRDQVIARLGAQPEVFVHGDCHTGNVVHADRGLAFCDWQSAGLGRASADLAFLSVRATPAGVRIPSSLVRDYLAHRSADQDPAALQATTLLEELAVYVFEWPPFAAYNDSAGVARVRRRARALADQLGDAGIDAGIGREPG
ncbi:phosphotransferase family protein [Promicromonospora iranensis]|uniref:Aminoglycoside phosphotransferase (APT) family kinase protein n=1 Tax=Promicromonospora iranensis TaxID=1105144 RepID=A0ABU2CWQ3_9MICO|nr:aminoglycoside phosphotransferase family protein [Promicromonospora iranensis]MDR7385750.1 aminoglycoside phosphotransferase (APT) family kinase protein [Promicromonospora iranensis]